MALTRLGLNQSINLTSNVTGTLPIANGGTNLSSGFINGTTAVGKILQVQNQRLTSEFNTTSGSYVDTGVTKSITPSAATSKILVIYGSGMNYTSSGTEMAMNCMRDSTQLNSVIINLDGTASTGGSAFMILDEPNTTSSVTYKVQIKRNNGGGNCYISVNNSLSTFTLMEIGA
jgi:hypothetical protein|tara:strand:+ start:623 stop:1144 length:522 start_codon:yes stop_codon:yes gene_type:complete